MTHTHTSGPWKITHNTTPGQFVTETKIRDKTNGVIATMHINSENNARLIAAAPELLAALIESLNYVVMRGAGMDLSQEALNELCAGIRAAISKAEGNA
jgi:hypothetical protein